MQMHVPDGRLVRPDSRPLVVVVLQSSGCDPKVGFQVLCVNAVLIEVCGVPLAGAGQRLTSLQRHPKVERRTLRVCDTRHIEGNLVVKVGTDHIAVFLKLHHYCKKNNHIL